MDIRQLHYFCTIVQEGQITRAAKKLHMAQPPLSQQLKQLEAELGVKLFERIGRNLELTNSGRVLYEKARFILEQVSEAKSEVKETDAGIQGVLSIGASKSCFSYLPQRMKIFHDHYPLVTYRLREGDTSYISQLLKNRDIELGIIRLPIELDNLHMISFPLEPYMLVIPAAWKDHAQGKTSIKMNRIKQMPLLLLHRINGKGQFEVVVDECRRHGFEPSIIGECPDASILLSLVSAGIGATIVPKSTLLSFQLENTIVLELEDAHIMAEAALVWLKDRYISKSTQRFIELFRTMPSSSLSN
ncbi:LysR family transcriptional regulator [Bacillus sp. 1P06AnD]|uniref:LysR family transcriptional regulator n=1 Tax=Bacillus sp. 1P06AnD TaxID=3132208 RepID=UPI0039A2F394